MHFLVTAKQAFSSYLAIALLIICACPVVAMDKVPQSLYEYYNMPNIDFPAHRDTRNMIAQRIVGPAGWWYPEAALAHGCFVNSVATHPTLPCVITGAEDGHMRVWELKTYTQITNHEKACEVGFGGEMNKVSTNGDFSIWANAFDRFVTIVKDQETTVTIRADMKIRSALLYPFKKNLLTILSVDTIPHNGQFNRKDFINVVDLETKETIARFGTSFYLVQRNVLAMALHPEGSLFALGQDKKLVLWNDSWNKVGVLSHDSSISGVAFDAQGTMLVTACQNGAVGLFDLNGRELPSIRHWRCSLDTQLYPKGTPEINDIKFHPSGKFLAIASQQGFIQFKDLVGNRLVQLHQHAIVKELAFISEGTSIVAVGGKNSLVLKNQDNAAIVWKQHLNPALDQVLLRCVLQKHLIACRVLCIDPEVCISKDDLVPWMAERFNLKQDELKKTWESMPEKLQTSIVRTLVCRASKIAELERKYHN